MMEVLNKVAARIAPLKRWRKHFRKKAIYPTQFKCGKVYDCVTFFNELDLLELRLNILHEVVDYFVIVEGNLTHTSRSKEFHFEAQRARFAQFESKIIYIKVEDFPDVAGLESDEFGRHTAWILERHQRNCIERGLSNAAANDVVLVSDLDEIPRPEYIEKFKCTTGVKIFEQRLFSCYLNLRNRTEPFWLNGTRMASYSDLLNTNSGSVNSEWVPSDSLGRPQALRFTSGSVIKDAGWHFTSLGGVDAILEKMKAFSHQELITNDIIQKEFIERRLATGEDIFGREVQYEIVEIDETYPDFIANHRDRYESLILKAQGAMKYGIEYDRVKERIETADPNSSWAFLCRAIADGSAVLEFGPSHGYMTKFLKEEKSCRMTIVEYDASCLDVAKEFAEKALVADVEILSQWVPLLDNDIFDYIVFGDVLEHLRNPEAVLREAVRFLKPDGRLLISLPNIAHNSVVIDLFNGKFDYRKLGIMDETHLRFFTLKSATKLIEGVGLGVEHVDKVVVPEEETFIRNSIEDLPQKMRRYFQERPDAQVFQYVLTAKFA